MTNTTITAKTARFFARYIAVPAVLVGAPLAMAGMASAATYSQPSDPGFNAPAVKAHPAPTVAPGWHNNHGTYYISNLEKQGFHR